MHLHNIWHDSCTRHETVSFAKEPYKRDYILQKRPMIKDDTRLIHITHSHLSFTSLIHITVLSIRHDVFIAFTHHLTWLMHTTRQDWFTSQSCRHNTPYSLHLHNIAHDSCTSSNMTQAHDTTHSYHKPHLHSIILLHDGHDTHTQNDMTHSYDRIHSCDMTCSHDTHDGFTLHDEWASVMSWVTWLVHMTHTTVSHYTTVSHSRDMRWLPLVGSLTLQVSFAKETYKRDYILQKRPIIWRSLLIVATRYDEYELMLPHTHKHRDMTHSYDRIHSDDMTRRYDTNDCFTGHNMSRCFCVIVMSSETVICVISTFHMT